MHLNIEGLLYVGVHPQKRNKQGVEGVNSPLKVGGIDEASTSTVFFNIIINKRIIVNMI